MSQQINLFNPLFLKQKKYFSAVTMLQGLALIVIGSAVFYGYARYQVSELGQQAAQTEKRLNQERVRLAKIAAEFSPQQKSKLLEDEIKTVEARIKARQEVVDTLKSGAIGNTEGYSKYMRAFARQSMEGLWLTGFSITGAGKEMVLNGRVLQPERVPAYIRRLNQEAVMQGRTFASLQIAMPKPDASKPGGKDAFGMTYLEFVLQSSEAEKAR